MINPSADLKTERSLMLLSRRSGLLISLLRGGAATETLQPFTNEGHLSLWFVNLHYRREHQFAQAGFTLTELDTNALLKDILHSHLQGHSREKIKLKEENCFIILTLNHY